MFLVLKYLGIFVLGFFLGLMFSPEAEEEPTEAVEAPRVTTTTIRSPLFRAAAGARSQSKEDSE